MGVNGTVPAIVAGVDGSVAGAAVLEWAADTASRQRCPLRLVHVVDVREFDTDAMSRKILAWADRLLAHCPHGNLEVTMAVRRGRAGDALVHAAEHARLLVVGRRGAGEFAELLLGATALHCATRSTVPVVVVPTDWRTAKPDRPDGGYLVVGVDGSPHSQAALELAFATAAERDLALTAVFAGPREAGLAVLSEAMTGWQEKYPDVAVTVVAEPDHPAGRLIRTACRADLLVVGKRGRGDTSGLGLGLGSVAHAVLRHAACPVAVVPTPKERAS